MQKQLIFLALFGAAQLGTSCQHEAEVRPRSYDALALGTGHWEWQRTLVGFSSNQTPTSVGFTRQLTFTTDGKVLIAHDNHPIKTTDYQLSMGTLAGCGTAQPATPIITYESESGINSGPRKAYTISKSGQDQYLSTTGDYACVDGGAYEEFVWVAE